MPRHRATKPQAIVPGVQGTRLFPYPPPNSRDIFVKKYRGNSGVGHPSVGRTAHCPVKARLSESETL